MEFSAIQTPALLLDEPRLRRNCAAMKARADQAGLLLRPHLKTAKCLEVARLACQETQPAVTVSTLAEARYFAEGGFSDLTYAVGLTPQKVTEVAALLKQGITVTCLSDNLKALDLLAAEAERAGVVLPMLIEIDSGGGRAGIDADGELLLALGQAIDASVHLELRGVLTHAGHSYGAQSVLAVKAIAEQERAAVVRASQRLRAAGLPCPVVSAGSTPTAVHARSFEGLTEIRPGVYCFYDLDQQGIGACGPQDQALSVLATVIGHNHRTGRILIDAGALALSKDISAADFFDYMGYGLVCKEDSMTPLADLYVAEAHQEHGMIAAASGKLPYDDFPVGTRLRVLLNHACMTAAAYDRYHLVAGAACRSQGIWTRLQGW
ncbi:alanine racemase [Rhodovibrionaceae bacterium A322]